MSTKSCRVVSLAIHPPVHVQRCLDCGCVSVHVGAITLRVDDEGLEALWAVIGTACATLHDLRLRHEPSATVRDGVRRGAA
jgi:hypothetical protein